MCCTLNVHIEKDFVYALGELAQATCMFQSLVGWSY